LKGNIVKKDQIRQLVELDLSTKPFMFVKMPKGVYDNVKFYMTLDITQQERDVAADMATLTTLFQTLVQKGDPRADKILNQIIGLTGNNPNKLLGNTENVVTQAQEPVSPTGQVSQNLSPLTPTVNA
jgi:hypothetical protein